MCFKGWIMYYLWIIQARQPNDLLHVQVSIIGCETGHCESQSWFMALCRNQTHCEHVYFWQQRYQRDNRRRDLIRQLFDQLHKSSWLFIARRCAQLYQVLLRAEKMFGIDLLHHPGKYQRDEHQIGPIVHSLRICRIWIMNDCDTSRDTVRLTYFQLTPFWTVHVHDDH